MPVAGQAFIFAILRDGGAFQLPFGRQVLHAVAMRMGHRDNRGRIRDKFPGLVGALLVLWLGLMGLQAQPFLAPVPTGALVKTGAPPVWVVSPVVGEDSVASPDYSSQGQVYELYDEEINTATAESYCHIRKKITSENGVQQGANLTFAYNPDYQGLVIHQITLHRDGQAYDRLVPERFKVIQQETDLNRQIYNGTVAALTFLDDVRVGDSIEFSYTVRGLNPVLAAHFNRVFYSRLMSPIKHWRVRRLWAGARELHYRSHGTELAPVILGGAGAREYVWEQRDVPPAVLEDEMPAWYPAFPWIQVSDFEDWWDVGHWAEPLYRPKVVSSPELEDRIRQLKQAGPDEDELVRAALDFVQRDIRYLGIETGANAFHPTDPTTVLGRRFGDCKDKAVLLCTLLNGLGIEASPVLVSTVFREEIRGLLPSPDDFNHVIVRVKGRSTYFVDATTPYQRGPVSCRNLPNYASGLLIAPGNSYLTGIPLAVVAASETVTREHFRVGGQTEPARLEVESVYTGGDADGVRAYLASAGEGGLAKDYLNDYARRYPEVREAGKLTVREDPDWDRLEIGHDYVITNFWVPTKDGLMYSGSFYALGISVWLNRPGTALRTTPLDLSFPRNRTVQTTVELPRRFALTDYTNLIMGPDSSLSVDRRQHGTNVMLSYEYQTFSDRVPTSQISAHLEALDKMREQLGYTLTWRAQEQSGPAAGTGGPIVWLAAVYAVMLAAGLAWLLRRPQEPPAPPVMAPPVRDPLAGLSGWLVVVVIRLFLGIIINIHALAVSIRVCSPSTWQALTRPESPLYKPGWGASMLFEFFSQITIEVLQLAVVYLFFKKRREFVRWTTVLICLTALQLLTDLILVQTVLKTGTANDFAKTVGAMIGGGLWILYLCQSRRVKVTFVQ